jgi:thymidylate synthase (FAD)
MRVLDRGHVHLVDHMGSDLTVCNAARVSFNKETDWCEDTEAISRLAETGSKYHKEDVLTLCESDRKLIRYLARHNHWTPFAHPQITLRIKAPISIRTQFFKHKQGFVENEISRRYVSYEPEFYYPEWRGKPTNGAKQGSEDFIGIDTETEKGYDNAIRACMYTYGQLVENGVAPEQARFVLPQGMYTEWYWTGSLAAYARFYSQRIDEHAQWEIRQYARAISNLIQPLFPESWKELTYINDPVKSNTEKK